MKSDDQLPDYEPMLAAYHRAFAAELRSIVAALPISEGQTVLDMACGDGAYGPWLAESVGVTGRVVEVDENPKYLEIARKAHAKSRAKVEFHRATIDTLPFEDGIFDLCWCAQSLYSLPDPVEAVKHMFRVTRPGGVVAVLEGDTLHHVILPWPVEVELSVASAELKVLKAVSDRPSKFYVGRNLRSVFRKAGFEEIVVQTVAHDRAAPLGQDERTFFTEYLKALAARVVPHLNSAMRRKLEALANPGSEEFLVNDPDLNATCVDQVAWGRKPLENRPA